MKESGLFGGRRGQVAEKAKRKVDAVEEDKRYYEQGP